MEEMTLPDPSIGEHCGIKIPADVQNPPLPNSRRPVCGSTIIQSGVQNVLLTNSGGQNHGGITTEYDTTKFQKIEQ
jgi:hypothetical protein